MSVNHSKFLAGASAMLSAGFTSLAAVASVYPNDYILAPVARLLDPFVFLLCLCALASALVSIACGARRTGGVLTLCAGLCAAFVYVSYHRQSLPLAHDLQADIDILFFNTTSESLSDPETIIDAVRAEQPDIVVLTEAAGLAPYKENLAKDYAFVSPCDEPACELLIATNLPVRRFWPLSLNEAISNRYAVLEIEQGAEASLYISVVHLLKPWITGFAESEIERLTAQYNWFDQPVVAVGDYNMAPWSYPMRRLLKDTGFQALRGQPRTWPRNAGFFGFAIDQILVRDGPRVTDIKPFGRDLGSNHSGFVATISLTAP